jgi:AcrR family transcriptional regulator
MSTRGPAVPTGVHLANARDLLFDAAERVLDRDGASGLTSRAVTTEAGVAKGVLHRHFVDFDAFLAELILDRTTKLDGPANALQDAAGGSTVVDNLAEALTAVFSPLAVAVVALVISRDGMRAHLRNAKAARFPLITEGSEMVSAYLTAEQALGRVVANADIATLSPTLIGSAHLLFTDREGSPPDAEAVRKVVWTVMQVVIADSTRSSGRASRGERKK